MSAKKDLRNLVFESVFENIYKEAELNIFEIVVRVNPFVWGWILRNVQKKVLIVSKMTVFNNCVNKFVDL